jgi:hypothetical protein
MLVKALSRLAGHARPEPARGVRSAVGAFPAGIARMVSPAGRISLALLQRMVQAVSREDFVCFMQAPVLVGSAIHQGTLSSAQVDAGPREMNRTSLFEPAEDTEHAASPSESLRHAVYPLVKGEHASSSGNFFSIGRTDGNDCIMPDYAISRKHAAIEYRRGVYLLKDNGSTNGTFLNGARLQTRPFEVHDRDAVSFARYDFSFLLPGSFYDMLRGA